MLKLFIAAGCLLTCFTANAQKTNAQKTGDTAEPLHKYLPDITVVGRNSKSDMLQLLEIVGTNINAGKKNSLIIMDNVQANVVTNTMRQVMAKIPGIHIWESDPSGIQIGIAARGLSPNRSWNLTSGKTGMILRLILMAIPKPITTRSCRPYNALK